ncbi:hypothetical protein [Fictibacillus sp. S7]|uniref:hypothetical protein n=1 Tax=Fictibacillus sp. S7 TaxID=2212476 RepID=UPI001011251B|nr:hypothetical protein [Fictibacillus sp. S7]RXY99516.1 hypothetical protein DMO16_07395 [Fictibacillus sp. S7]
MIDKLIGVEGVRSSKMKFTFSSCDVMLPKRSLSCRLSTRPAKVGARAGKSEHPGTENNDPSKHSLKSLAFSINPKNHRINQKNIKIYKYTVEFIFIHTYNDK